MKDGKRDTTCTECDMYCTAIQGCTPEEIDVLTPNKKSIEFEAGEVIVKQGTLSDYIYYLRRGVVKISVTGDNKRSVLLRVACAKDFIGLPALCMNEISPITIIALTDCKICQIRKSSFIKVVKSNENFQQIIGKSSGAEFNILYDRIINYGTSNNHGRLAGSLLYLASPDFVEIDIYNLLSRKELAELSAISLESMNKILKEFKNDKIIAINDKRITLLQPELLERICRAG